MPSLSTALITSFPSPGAYGETLTVTETTTNACATNAPRPVNNCRVPTGEYRIGILNFASVYLASDARNGNENHNSLILTTNLGSAISFVSANNGQATFVTGAGLTLWSQQTVGNEPVYFDALDNADGGYNSGDDAVQFCLQSDNSFVVQNPTSGATSVMICSGTIYLFTEAAAASSGCTPVTLILA